MGSEVYMRGSVTITNMSSEMFNDALFYKEQAQKTENIFTKWRYYRSALINYCISVEAWVNKLLTVELEKRQSAEPLVDKYQKLYSSLIEDLEFPPQGIKLSNYKKLKEYLPELYGFKVLPDSSLDNVIDKYIKITKYRNKIIHYSQGNYKTVYNTEDLKECIDNAPKNIEELFNELNNASEKLKELGYPLWFKERQSRNI